MSSPPSPGWISRDRIIAFFATLSIGGLALMTFFRAPLAVAGFFGNAAVGKFTTAVSPSPENAAWKSKDRPTKPTPRKPLSPEDRARFRDEDDKFYKEAMRLSDESLNRDAASNPQLRAVLDLLPKFQTPKNYSATQQGMREWGMAAKDKDEQMLRLGFINEISSITALLSVTSQWYDERLGSIVNIEDKTARQQLALKLIDVDINPTYVLIDNADTARKAIESIHKRLYEKLDESAKTAKAPADLFNRQRYDEMIDWEIMRTLVFKTTELASPETRQLHQTAMGQIREFRKEAEKRMWPPNP